ncbi:hypothetical protein IPF86_02345 [Candidatus Nomurabacteria bacterium]|jgi:hypothetical protein|nr:MAG: hypothetical protein IPF86_02345 [Candidatus Nomurabacteria bacterium]
MLEIQISRRCDYSVQNLNSRLFKVLEALNVYFTTKEKDIIDKVFASIDFADQIIDDNYIVIDNPQRQILGFVVGELEVLPCAIPKNVVDHFVFVRDIIAHKKNAGAVQKQSLALFEVHDNRLCTNSEKEYVRLTIAESIGHYNVLMLLFPDNKLTEQAKKFMLQASMIGSLADNLIDLKEDYSSGSIKIKPSFTLQLRLQVALMRASFKAFYLYPSKLEALILGLRYIKYSLGFLKKVVI